MNPILLLAAALTLPAFAQPAQWFYAATGANPAAILGEVDRFRRDLGELNPNEAKSFPAGRREINWDGVGGTLGNDNLPGDFFHKTSPRGLLMATPGRRLKVSGDTGSPSFLMRDVTRDEWGLAEFGPFSGEKFFAPIGSTITDLEFRIPGTDEPACVRGFGAVFMDIDRGGQSFMTIFLTDGTTRTFKAQIPPAKSKGLSFIAVRYQDACIANVRINSGDHPVDTPDIPVPFPDGVALDDFIYGEPVPITLKSAY
jgi:hypothetical protein